MALILIMISIILYYTGYTPDYLAIKHLLLIIKNTLFYLFDRLERELIVFYSNVLYVVYIILSDLINFFSKIGKPYLKNFLGHSLASFLNFLLEMDGFFRFLIMGLTPDELFVFKHVFVFLLILHFIYSVSSRQQDKNVCIYTSVCILFFIMLYVYIYKIL